MPRIQYINVTERRTVGRTTYDSNTALALRASRGKKKKQQRQSAIGNSVKIDINYINS